MVIFHWVLLLQHSKVLGYSDTKMVQGVRVGEEARWPEDAVVQTAWADMEASVQGSALFPQQSWGASEPQAAFVCRSNTCVGRQWISREFFSAPLRFLSPRSMPVENMFLWGSAWNTTPATVRRDRARSFKDAEDAFCLSVCLLHASSLPLITISHRSESTSAGLSTY